MKLEWTFKRRCCFHFLKTFKGISGIFLLFFPVFQRQLLMLPLSVLERLRTKRLLNFLKSVLESWTIVRTMKSKQTEIGQIYFKNVEVLKRNQLNSG